MRTVVVTGANRGIGLALAQVYVERGWQVVAACRSPAGASALAGREWRAPPKVEQLDMASPASIEAFAARLSGRAIDMLVNNAGVYHRTARLEPFDRAAWEETLDVNLLGAMHVTALLLPHLRQGATRKIIAVSSALGSIATSFGGSNSYRSAKAGLNMGMRNLAQELSPEGFTIAAISPGVVDTELARDVPVDKISATDSAEAMADLIEALGPADTGCFLRHSGERLEW